MVCSSRLTGLQAYMAYMNDQMDIWDIYIYVYIIAILFCFFFGNYIYICLCS